MAEIAIGYNISNAKNLMQSIHDSFGGLKETIVTEWGDVSSKLESEWVGEDEVSFEQQFAKKINQLYVNSAGVANFAISVIADTCNAWNAFQNNNLLDNVTEVTGNRITVDIADYKVEAEENIVSAGSVTLDENTDRGLKSSTSASDIQTQVSTFVSQVKSKCTDLFGETKSSTAFYGEGQTTKLDELLVKCEESIGVVVTAVKDLNDALSVLAGSGETGSYGAQVSAVAEAQGENATTLDTQIDESIGANSRWSESSE